LGGEDAPGGEIGSLTTIKSSRTGVALGSSRTRWGSPTSRRPGRRGPFSTTLACCRPPAHPSRQPASTENSPRRPGRTTCSHCS